MSSDPTIPEARAADTLTANIALSSSEWEMQFKLTVPAGPTTLKELLPLAQKMSDAVVDATVRVVENNGAKISCCKGCGACCRQLVPISDVEARRIAELVQALPEPRRSQVLARFTDALQRLSEAGLLEKLNHQERWFSEGYVALGLEYFRLGIPCPFLEDESCSIHPDRPVTCREFLVTSPAENCRNPTQETVKSVHLPMRVAPALALFSTLEVAPQFVRWVPLVLALEWAAEHPDPPAVQTGPELLGEFLEHLTGQQIPAPQVSASSPTGSRSENDRSMMGT